MKLGFDESLLKEAFDIRAKAFCETLPSEEEYEKITFSPEFEKRMEKLLKQEQTFYYYWFNTVGKRVASVILIVVIGLLTTTFSVKALRDPFLKFVVEAFEKFTSIFVENEDLDDDFVFTTINPGYIPEGYILERQFEGEVNHWKVYQNPSGLSFIYKQEINDSISLIIDTENTEYEELYINDTQTFYHSNKGTETFILCDKSYIFTVTGTAPKEELLKIAESIQIK